MRWDVYEYLPNGTERYIGRGWTQAQAMSLLNRCQFPAIMYARKD